MNGTNSLNRNKFNYLKKWRNLKKKPNSGAESERKAEKAEPKNELYIFDFIFHKTNKQSSYKKESVEKRT